VNGRRCRSPLRAMSRLAALRASQNARLLNAKKNPPRRALDYRALMVSAGIVNDARPCGRRYEEMDMSNVVNFLNPDERKAELQMLAIEVAAANPGATGEQIRSILIEAIKKNPQLRLGAFHLAAETFVGD